MSEEDKENNPSETAVLQQTVTRLNSDLHNLRLEVTHRDSEIQRITSHCEQLQMQLQEQVQNGKKK